MSHLLLELTYNYYLQKIIMNLTFYKYQGAGNDFIMIDNRDNFFPKKDIKGISLICDRRFGVGGDGLILLENDKDLDFNMVYYNADGNEGSMCGNGGRCIIAFAQKLGMISSQTKFNAVDGEHYATINTDNTISLQMIDVKIINVQENYTFLNTGSPHHVVVVEDVKNVNVKTEGALIRYSNLYGKEGSNVNFVQYVTDDEFDVRTYERGVEDETLACGTGVTAAAIALYETGKTNKTSLKMNVLGGKLKVTFNKIDNVYKDVFLIGPAKFVFKGQLEM